MTREEILNQVWADAVVEEGNLSYTVSLLRKALGDDWRTFPNAPVPSPWISQYDVANDGRFLVLEPMEAPSLTVLINWAEE